MQWLRRSPRIYSQTYVQFIYLCSISPPGECLNGLTLTRYIQTLRLLLRETGGEGCHDGEKIDKKQSSTSETRPTPQFGTLEATSLSEGPSRRRCIVSELAPMGPRPPSSEFDSECGWQRNPMACVWLSTTPVPWLLLSF